MNKDSLIITEVFYRKFITETKRNIKRDFRKIHLSGNLMDTITVEWFSSQRDHIIFGLVDPGEFLEKPVKVAIVHIPAVRYDLKRYREDMVVIHHPEWGSYAQEVNITGGFSGKHVGYVENAIYQALATSIRSAKINASKIGQKVTVGSIEER